MQLSVFVYFYIYFYIFFLYVGYDMRTLRKQIDYLQTDIKERIEIQELLYIQNNELWTYSKSLLECNKNNIILMKSHITCLHNEMKVLYQDR